jgi:hypothetical protein
VLNAVREEKNIMRNTTRFLLIVGFLAIASSPAFAQTCVQADNAHPDSVALNWQDNSTDESGFVDWTGRKRYTSYCVRVRGDKADAEYSQMSCATTSK